MNTHTTKNRGNKGQANATSLSNQQTTGHLVNNRPAAIAQRKLQGMANQSLSVNNLRVKQATQLKPIATRHSIREQNSIQRKGNNTGLPDQLKSGIENLSGYSLDDVRVHYNSPKPVQLNAYAYAQGTDIYVGPGQEKYLAHEAWHVVQQKQGRVSPTIQVKGNSVNDDVRLEREADIMGAKALSAVSQLKGGKLMPGSLPAMPGKAPLQARWAAKKIFSDGRELRYWKPGVEDAENKFRQGWYARAFDGGWGDSARFVNADPLVLDAPGVESLSRLAFPSASDHKLMVVEERAEFAVEGRGRREAMTSMPKEIQLQRFSEIAAWCAAVDSVIELFERNEQDVKLWRNRLAALSAAQIALGLVAGGLIVAGIVATGGLAAIPMAAGAIAIGVSSAAVGVGVGAARAVAEHGLSNAQQEQGIQSGKAKVGGLEVAKGGAAVGGKELITRGFMAAAEAGAAEVVGVAAGGGGAAISVIKGGMGAHRAYKVDVGEIYKQVKWGELLKTVRQLQKLVKSNSAGLDVMMITLVEAKLKNTGDKIFRIRPMKQARTQVVARLQKAKAKELARLEKERSRALRSSSHKSIAGFFGM